MGSRYVFRGNAIGVTGLINKPEDLIIWTQGVSSLPVIGGYSQSSAGATELPGYLSFRSVSTRASGAYSQSERAYKTLVMSSISGIEVARRLTVDILDASMISVAWDKGGQPSIGFEQVQIQNLRVDGYSVSVKLEPEVFTRLDTKDKLAKAYRSDDKFFKEYRNRFLPRSAASKRQIQEHNGIIVCSIARQVETNHPNAKIDGHILTLPGFGKIYVGELLITSNSRRLTLLRIELGSPVGGLLACLEVESNGDLLPF